MSGPGHVVGRVREDGGIRRGPNDEAGPVVETRGFLADPGSFLRHL